MKIAVNELKPGFIIDYKGKLWAFVKGDHVKPGKGPAYLQAELKGVPDGAKLNQRFNTSETVEAIELDQADHQFLYAESDEQLVFMNQESFEQIAFSRTLIGESAVFLQEGMVVKVKSHDGQPLIVVMPDKVVCEIVQADPVVKGQTAASSYKPAILDNGVRVMVPPHIETGTRIVINVAEGTYSERARS